MQAALDATEAELQQLEVQLEAKRTFVAGLDDLVRASSTQSHERRIRAGI